MTAWHAALAWLPDGIRENVLIEANGERLLSVIPAVAPPPGAERLHGLVLPGLANAHSHAFQRALRGRTEAGAGDFWAWRELMYALAGSIDPDTMFELSRAAFVEMALAGIAAVGEFHYVHHAPGGRAYADPNEMGRAVAAAAGEAGLRMTLLDACYLRGGLDDRPLEGPQLRFGDPSATAWGDRLAALEPGPGLLVGAAIHSVRAVDPGSAAEVAGWAAGKAAPLHFHLSEQAAENRDCLAATGSTPAGVLDRAGALGPRSTAVHATHVDSGDIGRLGDSRAAICMCPTTERDLADGVGPAAELRRAGARLCVGSDSQAVIDLFEEARAIELDERLVTGERGRHPAAGLIEAMTSDGMAALGWDSGRLEAGRLADLTVIGLDSVRLGGWDRASLPGQVVFAAAAADVTDLVVGGRRVVAAGRHLALGDPGPLLDRAVAKALTGLSR